MIDLFPTLNELCDLPSISTLDGKSIVPLLQDASQPWDQPALTTHSQGNHAVCDEGWRYIRYAHGDEELYDVANDPNEWTNLASKPEFTNIKAELARALPTTNTAPLNVKKRKGQ